MTADILNTKSQQYRLVQYHGKVFKFKFYKDYIPSSTSAQYQQFLDKDITNVVKIILGQVDQDEVLCRSFETKHHHFGCLEVFWPLSRKFKIVSNGRVLENHPMEFLLRVHQKSTSENPEALQEQAENCHASDVADNCDESRNLKAKSHRSNSKKEDVAVKDCRVKQKSSDMLKLRDSVGDRQTCSDVVSCRDDIDCKRREVTEVSSSNKPPVGQQCIKLTVPARNIEPEKETEMEIHAEKKNIPCTSISENGNFFPMSYSENLNVRRSDKGLDLNFEKPRDRTIDSMKKNDNIVSVNDYYNKKVTTSSSKTVSVKSNCGKRVGNLSSGTQNSDRYEKTVRTDLASLCDKKVTSVSDIRHNTAPISHTIPDGVSLPKGNASGYSMQVCYDGKMRANSLGVTDTRKLCTVSSLDSEMGLNESLFDADFQVISSETTPVRHTRANVSANATPCSSNGSKSRKSSRIVYTPRIVMQHNASGLSSTVVTLVPMSDDSSSDSADDGHAFQSFHSSNTKQALTKHTGVKEVHSATDAGSVSLQRSEIIRPVKRSLESAFMELPPVKKRYIARGAGMNPQQSHVSSDVCGSGLDDPIFKTPTCRNIPVASSTCLKLSGIIDKVPTHNDSLYENQSLSTVSTVSPYDNVRCRSVCSQIDETITVASENGNGREISSKIEKIGQINLKPSTGTTAGYHEETTVGENNIKAIKNDANNNRPEYNKPEFIVSTSSQSKQYRIDTEAENSRRSVSNLCRANSAELQKGTSAKKFDSNCMACMEMERKIRARERSCLAGSVEPARSVTCLGARGEKFDKTARSNDVPNIERESVKGAVGYIENIQKEKCRKKMKNCTEKLEHSREKVKDCGENIEDYIENGSGWKGKPKNRQEKPKNCLEKPKNCLEKPKNCLEKPKDHEEMLNDGSNIYVELEFKADNNKTQNQNDSVMLMDDISNMYSDSLNTSDYWDTASSNTPRCETDDRRVLDDEDVGLVSGSDSSSSHSDVSLRNVSCQTEGKQSKSVTPPYLVEISTAKSVRPISAMMGNKQVMVDSTGVPSFQQNPSGKHLSAEGFAAGKKQIVDKHGKHCTHAPGDKPAVAGCTTVLAESGGAVVPCSTVGRSMSPEVQHQTSLIRGLLEYLISIWRVLNTEPRI